MPKTTTQALQQMKEHFEQHKD
jgi:tetratricopeptide (TPR) repeat protein